MKYSSTSTVALLISMLVLLCFVIVLERHASPIDFALCLSVFFATLVPAAFVMARRQIRASRLRRADLLREYLNAGEGLDRHFEFLERKYHLRKFGSQNGDVLKAFSASVWRETAIIAASLPFILFTAAGFFLLFLPAAELPKLLDGSLGANILSVGGLSAAGPKDYENALTIASLAFAGAFLYCLRMFLRSLIAFDLSAIAFLRAFAHMLLATMLALVVWRAAPGAAALYESAARLQGAPAAAERKAASVSRAPAEAPEKARAAPVPAFGSCSPSGLASFQTPDFPGWRGAPG